MSTPEIELKIEKIKEEMDNYYNIKNGFVFNLNFLKNKNIFFILPIISFIILFFTKPSFLSTKDPKNKKIFSIKKFFYFWIILNIIVFLASFFYLKKINFF